VAPHRRVSRCALAVVADTDSQIWGCFWRRALIQGALARRHWAR